MSWVEEAMRRERAARESDRAAALLNACANLSPFEELALRRLVDLALQGESGSVVDDGSLAAATRLGVDWPAARAQLIRLGKIQLGVESRAGSFTIGFIERGLR